MQDPKDCLLSLNKGSTNLKFGLSRTGEDSNLYPIFRGQALCVEDIANFLLHQGWVSRIYGVGHRIVHGGPLYRNPVILNKDIIKNLRNLLPLDPEHLPQELLTFESAVSVFPDLPQCGCFDTGFHQTMSLMAQSLAIPQQLKDREMIRYGFHGLSCESILDFLHQQNVPRESYRRMIIAHLGGGSSLTAVLDSKSIETTMGFSPCEGVPMGTRSGSLDPMVVLEILEKENLSIPQMREFFNKKSGVLGLSELTSDMKTLLDQSSQNKQASETVDLYCYQIKKSIGSLVAALGGLDTLVFTGGIGENAPPIRAKIVQGLGCFGIEVEPASNEKNGSIISSGLVAVRVIKTDEERMIALHTQHLLKQVIPKKLHSTKGFAA